MFSPQIRGFLYGILITTSLVSVVTYASTHSDGVFGEYFERMTGFCDETNGEILTGLAKTADGEPFATKRCTSIKDLLANVFGLLGGAPDGQAMLGFDVDGEPIYGDVNWHNDGTNITYTGGNVGIGTTSPAYKLDTSGDIINDGWYRSRGDTGWYSETHGGGMYMMDSTWVRTWNAKSLWTNNFLGSNAGLTVGYGGTSSPLGGAIIQGNVGIGTSAPTVKLDVAGTVKTTELCINGNCKSAWPSGIQTTIVTGAVSACRGTSHAECPAGYTVVSGGYTFQGSCGCDEKHRFAVNDYPSGNGWSVFMECAYNQAYAVCAR